MQLCFERSIVFLNRPLADPWQLHQQTWPVSSCGSQTDANANRYHELRQLKGWVFCIEGSSPQFPDMLLLTFQEVTGYLALVWGGTAEIMFRIPL